MAERVLVSIPRETVNDETVLILGWKVASGSRVERDELICEVETSKAVLEIHAPAPGFVVYECASGDELPVGATLCSIESAAPLAVAGSSRVELPTSDVPAARLSAAALRASAEYGLAASSFAPGTLVRQQDVLRAVGKTASDGSRTVPVEWSQLPRRKLLERKILQRGREMTVQSSVTSACRVAQVANSGMQALIIFEAARLLRRYSEFNALFDGGRIGKYTEVNVGWALDGGQGLVVPVIREADQKTIHEVASTMERQTEAYLENALSSEDLLGGTFTVTDLSGQSVSFFQPLLVEGQSAILGIGRADMTLYLTLAFDHQVAEGRRAAEFSRELCQRLEVHATVAAPSLAVEAPSQARQYCALCQRDSKTLQNMKVVLLKSEVPQGFVCSLCVAGW